MADHPLRAAHDRALPQDHQNFRTMLAVHAGLQSTLQLSASMKSNPDISSEILWTSVGSSIGPLLSPGRLDQLRSQNRLATLLVRDHEITAVTTNISDTFWMEIRQSQGNTVFPKIIYVTANPRLSKIYDDILAYDGPEPFKIIRDPECEIDINSPYEWLRENWWVMSIIWPVFLTCV